MQLKFHPASRVQYACAGKADDFFIYLSRKGEYSYICVLPD